MSNVIAKQRVLLVDDEPAIVEILKMRLEHNGYEVITAYDGQEALEKARTLAPSLILLDIMLPKLDGYKVCKLLKFDEKYAHIPIIMQTALAQPEDEKAAYESGADNYLIKPFEPAQLLDAIVALLPKPVSVS
jgi:two-component system, OmpR family, alkaline phosphatase synthesis response regulator PhoP